MKQVLLIALLDKEWPPDHSFVSGMLAKVAARQHWLKVNLLVSGNKHKSMHVRRFKKLFVYLCSFQDGGLVDF